MNDCLFCKIIAKQIPANFVYESEKIVAFPDIHPSAEVHLLIVPKKHIREIREIREIKGDKGNLLVEVYQAAMELVKENNLEDNLYRIVVNGGKAQQIKHLHFHLLGGEWKKFV